MVFRWCARLSLAAILVGIPLHAVVVHGRTPQAARPFSVATRSDGLKLTLQTPRASYPPDALVPVTVTLRNRSNGEAAIEQCAGFLPVVQMLDASAREINQPTIPTGITHPACFDPTAPGRFPVGQSVSWHGLMILRAPQLRAAETIYRPGEMFTAPGTYLQTPILRLHPLRVARTHAVMLTTPYLHVDVRAPAGARIYYSDRVDCFNPYTGASFGGSQGWTLATGHTITPSSVDICAHMTRWRVAIAVEGTAPVWLDHRISLPALPAHRPIEAPQCRSMPPHGVSAIAAAWRGAIYVVAANGAHNCRLTGNVGAKDARLAPGGRWATWLAPDRTRRWIDYLWVGRTDGAARPVAVRGATFGTPNAGGIWSPGGKLLAYGRGGSVFVARPGSAKPTRLATYSTLQSQTLFWLPNGAAIATQVGPSSFWAHEVDLKLVDLHGQTRGSVVRFPAWLSNPNARPIGSRPVPPVLIGTDDHVFVATSGGGVRVSGIWEAAMHTSPAVNAARLVIGTRARVQGRPAPAVHLDGATHIFGSPGGRYLVVDPRTGFWVEDTRTLQGHLVPIASQANCVVSQSAWMGGDRAIAFVRTCRLAGGTGFRSTLWSVSVTGGLPRRLLTAVDYQPDSISIDTVYRCLGCGYNPGS